LPVLGFPISEPFQERNADTGQTYLVQYFERYRLEYHPETNGIEIGRLGVQDAQMRGYLPH
jgi:polysaccharide biosynthesis protein PslG